MATGDPIDRAFLEIDGVQIDCESIDIGWDDKTDWVDAMTRDNEPLGVVSGNRHAEVKASVTMREDEDDDIDLFDTWESKTNVAVAIEFKGGRTASFAKGRLSKPSIKSKGGDKTQWDLELKCWQCVLS